METKYIGENLPTSKETWQSAARRHGNVSIHELQTACPASEINVAQFLSLKAIWPKRRALTELYNDNTAKLFGSSKIKIEMTRHNMWEHDSAWKAYIKAIEDHKLHQSSKFSRELGIYSLVLQNQLEVQQIENRIEYSNKLRFTSLTGRYDMRKRDEKLDIKGKGKESRPESQVSRHRSQTSKISSDPSDISPMGHDAVPDLQIGDEQTVNTAAINFLNALFVHDERFADWTLQRKRFKFHSKSVNFEARTDGHLKIHDEDKSAAILEVKSRGREHELGFRIAMQESAQMALWIFQEPNRHWAKPSGGDEHYRVLLSQDREEIYVTIAEYTMNYVLYLRDEKNIDEAGFLKMNMFGPFYTTNHKHMSWLGPTLRTLLPYAANYQPTLQLSSSKLRTPPPRSAQSSGERVGRAPERRPQVGQQPRSSASPTQRGQTESLSSTSSESRQQPKKPLQPTILFSNLSLKDNRSENPLNQPSQHEGKSDSQEATLRRSDSPFRSIPQRAEQPPGPPGGGQSTQPEQISQQGRQQGGEPSRKKKGKGRKK